ncbi:concanavalin A-like lectin/glucanase [Rhizoclosmatium globosum]|uniref:Concanavalin A-like lectin/glucanase n=1 Tax=Rhizoclosmatium globosum TaxID=329046 RepID=A0A1Y2B544_9FUNG|nr:concanavalin A-like lectin/glucanase [Rhizoclosmatium globosum]|eukprot:ORY29215.1 concanavalin A-like lectin/glucanase [Rhizoclosmatium globosum]
MFAIKRWVSMIGIIVSLGIAGVIIYFKVKNALPKYQFCKVLLDESFDGDSINKNVWSHEFSMGGPIYNGAFDLTTDAPSNSYVKDGSLYIKPTLTTVTGAEFFKQAMTDSALLTSNMTLNLTSYGCFGGDASCYRNANITNGTMIPPVMSARLTTKGKFNFKFGKGEIQFRAPRGDWMWPAIWMMPEKDVYGTWPFSGEIDLMESYGNGKGYMGGAYRAISSLHYGMDFPKLSYRKDYGFEKMLRRGPLFSTTHTIGWEWTPTYFKTWLDNPLRTIMYINFDQTAYKRAGFPFTFPNGTAINDPWASSNSTAAPFDQEFYLILNVAVGGTNGWFQDFPNSGKPWDNSRPTPDILFHESQDKWYPTWGEGESGAMKVDYVKIWGMC